MMPRAPLAIVALAGTFLLAVEPASPPLANTNQAIIRFQGSATLHEFHGSVGSQPIQFQRTGQIWSAQGMVAVTGLSTANNQRDQKMQQMFAAATFPTITGSISNAPVPISGATNVLMQLRIRDQQHAVPVQITDWRQTGRHLQFNATAAVSLKQFGLKPPSVLGVLRVGDTVRLQAAVSVWEPAP